MANKIFVGGLPYEMTEDRFREVFSEFGPIQYLKIIVDQETGRSRGFGFVEYETDAEAAAAVKGTGGVNIDGRFLTVREAVDRRPTGPRPDRWQSPTPEVRGRPVSTDTPKKVRENRRRVIRRDDFGGPDYD